MSLINCRECGREISSLASACPGCGAPPRDEASSTDNPPLKPPPLPPSVPPSVPHRVPAAAIPRLGEAKSSHKQLIVALLVALGFVIMAIVLSQSHKVETRAAPVAMAEPNPPLASSMSPPAAETATPSASVEDSQTQLDKSSVAIIERAKAKLTWRSTSDELRAAQTELLTIPANDIQYTESTGILKRVGEYLSVAERAEEQAAAKWRYSQSEDKIGRGGTKFATVESDNVVNLDFPYQGEQHAALKLQRKPKSDPDVFIQIEHGQFFCPESDGCEVAVRFDDGQIMKFKGGEANDGRSNVLFIKPYSRFIAQLRKSRKVAVEVLFFQQGTRVFEFTTGGLDW